MKKSKILLVCMIIMLVFSMTVTAFAGYWQDVYAAAEASGNTAAMEAAHAGAVASGTSNVPSEPVTVPAPPPPVWYDASKDNSNVANPSTNSTAGVSNAAIESLLAARGLAVTDTNKAAAAQEIKGYVTSNNVFGNQTTATQSMYEGGNYYVLDSNTGTWLLDKTKAYSGSFPPMTLDELETIAQARQVYITSSYQVPQDTAAMAAAHATAEAIRNGYNYSGGSDGAYISDVLAGGGGSVSTTQYSITASVVGKGAITPAGTTTVTQLGNVAYIITPNAGFKIANVYVDGSAVGPKSSFTFTSVTSNHAISAEFVSELTLSTGTPSISGLTGGKIKSGYGFGLSVPVTTNGNAKVTATIGTKTYAMELVNGAYVLPQNPNSPSNPKSRVHYIPVNTPSGTKLPVSITVTTANAHDATDTLTATKSTTVLVEGNMYQDDAVGDR